MGQVGQLVKRAGLTLRYWCCSIAVNAGDSCLAAVIAEGGDAASSAVRIYDIGRHPALVSCRSSLQHCCCTAPANDMIRGNS